jgi:hypothetical protein
VHNVKRNIWDLINFSCGKLRVFKTIEDCVTRWFVLFLLHVWILDGFKPAAADDDSIFYI